MARPRRQPALYEAAGKWASESPPFSYDLWVDDCASFYILVRSVATKGWHSSQNQTSLSNNARQELTMLLTRQELMERGQRYEVQGVDSIDPSRLITGEIGP
jgi:hypothetical protein